MQNVVINISDVFERLKSALSLRNDAELARRFGEPPKKLAVWKLRNTVPLELMISFCRHEKLNLEWVLTGEKMGFVAEETSTYRCIDLVTQRINEHLEQMDAEARRDVLKYTEEKKLLRELMAERQNKRG